MVLDFQYSADVIKLSMKSFQLLLTLTCNSTEIELKSAASSQTFIHRARSIYEMKMKKKDQYLVSVNIECISRIFMLQNMKVRKVQILQQLQQNWHRFDSTIYDELRRFEKRQSEANKPSKRRVFSLPCRCSIFQVDKGDEERYDE